MKYIIGIIIGFLLSLSIATYAQSIKVSAVVLENPCNIK